ncbi:hypothetical protein CDAR_256471 [Caerostris darwini]|uniref:Uncharacterized protein n=1 Tax=Caerostris darwini TaxID=1538125 RepID=A0AAV4SEJ7_9ARAC|nr:hypothetical protein CDAR_256471 [Caerostris darwini]
MGLIVSESSHLQSNELWNQRNLASSQTSDVETKHSVHAKDDLDIPIGHVFKVWNEMNLASSQASDAETKCSVSKSKNGQDKPVVLRLRDTGTNSVGIESLRPIFIYLKNDNVKNRISKRILLG